MPVTILAVPRGGPVTDMRVSSGHFMMVMMVHSDDAVNDDYDNDDDGDTIGESKRGTCHRYEGLLWPLYPTLHPPWPRHGKSLSFSMDL